MASKAFEGISRYLHKKLILPNFFVLYVPMQSHMLDDIYLPINPTCFFLISPSDIFGIVGRILTVR